MIFDIPADVAYIAGVWCEGVLFGFHVILFAAVWSVLRAKSRREGREVLSMILLGFSTCMFIVSTAHVSLALHELLQGFVYEREIPPPVFFRINIFPARKALYIVNTLLGDSLLVWRVYAVWGSSWKITLAPALLFLGTTVCGLKTIVANATTPAASVFTSDLLSWVTSTFVLTIATQITATALIAGRIYHVARLNAAVGSQLKTRYVPIIWTIVESGAVYTSAALVQLVTYLLHMNAGVILEMMLAQLSVMIPISIIVRVALGLAHGGSTTRKGEGHRQMSTFRVKASGSASDASVTLGGPRGSRGHEGRDRTQTDAWAPHDESRV